MSITTTISRRSWIISALCSVAAVVALGCYLEWPQAVTHRFLLLVAAVVLTGLCALFLLGSLTLPSKDAEVREALL